MRSGHLLAEESPQLLLSKHNLQSLEDVFLKLCLKDRQPQGAAAAAAASAASAATNGNGAAAGAGAAGVGVDNPAFTPTEGAAHDDDEKQRDADADSAVGVNDNKALATVRLSFYLRRFRWASSFSIVSSNFLFVDFFVVLTF